MGMTVEANETLDTSSSQDLSKFEHEPAPVPRILGDVDRSDIGSIKEVVQQIIHFMDTETATAKELQEIIEADPPFVARLLRTANSPYYGSPRQISGIREAIIWIGFDALKELALTQKVCEIFRPHQPFYDYSRNEVWKHSVAVAIASKLLARYEFGQYGNLIYVCGLLHDIGLILEDQFVHQEFREILQRSHEQDIGIAEAEHRILGIDHAYLGSRLAEYWDLPPVIVAAIAGHHTPDSVPSEHFEQAAIVYIADYFVQQFGYGFSTERHPDRETVLAVLDNVGIRLKAIDHIMEKVGEQLERFAVLGWW